jgi:hypothetical protein
MKAPAETFGTIGTRHAAREEGSLEAYVLIQREKALEPLVGALRTIPGVVWAEQLRGPYDGAAPPSGGPAGRSRLRLLPRVEAA